MPAKRKFMITDALISSGYTSLDQQAKALGLNRATVWTIRENKHKLGRLSAKTIERIITNPTTPPRVLAALQEYVVEKWVAPEQPKRRDRQSALREARAYKPRLTTTLKGGDENIRG